MAYNVVALIAPLAAHDGTPGAHPGPVVSGALISWPVVVS